MWVSFPFNVVKLAYLALLEITWMTWGSMPRTVIFQAGGFGKAVS